MSSVPQDDLEHILAHTRDLWEAVREQNLFVTGGTGFFGRWLVESFAFINGKLGLGAHMTVLTRNPEAFAAKAPALAANPAVRFIRGDVRYLEHAKVLAQVQAGHSGAFPFMVHAAMDFLGRDDPLATFDTAVSGTRAVLDFAIASSTKRFLLTSSGAVYGAQSPEVSHLPESCQSAPDCTRPISAYGEGKRAAELLCACYHAGQPAFQPMIARCFAIVGPFLPIDAHFAIGNFIRDALRGGPIRVSGDGTPRRSYLYAADLAVWLWTILFRGRPIRPYNVGSEEDVTILELASMVAECFSSGINVELACQPTPGGAPSRYVPATGLATGELGIEARIGLKEALSRTAAWHSRQSP